MSQRIGVYPGTFDPVTTATWISSGVRPACWTI